MYMYIMYFTHIYTHAADKKQIKRADPVLIGSLGVVAAGVVTEEVVVGQELVGMVVLREEKCQRSELP